MKRTLFYDIIQINYRMKNFSKLFFFLLVMTLILPSCTKESKKNENIEAQLEAEFRNSLNKEDSLRVVSLGDSVMNLFKENKIEQAISCISQLDTLGNIQSLDDSRRIKLVRQFKFFPVNDFKLVDFIFNTSDQNIITYKISFDANSVETSTSTTNFAFSPVKVDGIWYLTIRQSALSDGHNSKAEVESNIE